MSAIDYAAMDRSVRRHKAAMTKARRKGPAAVIAAVEAAFADWDRPGMAYPDGWHAWERARLDAEFELRRQAWQPELGQESRRDA